MSLWTPGGEHPVDKGGSQPPTAPPPGEPEMTPEQEAEARQIAEQMAQVREQLSQVPAAQVVANHAMGCYELAAIHLSSEPPKFAEAGPVAECIYALRPRESAAGDARGRI